MEYVFGTTLVCEDADTAKRVTFDPAVRMKSVTLEGDVYDPSGTLSGGSSPQTSGVLVTLQKLNELTKELEMKEQALHRLQTTMAQEKQKLDAARKLKQGLDLKTHEISLAEQQINSNSSSSIIQAVADMKANILELKQSITDAKARQDEAGKEAKRIEKDMSDFSNNKDSKLTELQSSLDKLKKAHSKNSASIKPLQQEVRDAMLESEQCSSDLSSAQEQFQDTSVSLRTQSDELTTLLTSQTAVKNSHDLALAHLEDERRKLSSFDSELHDLESTSRSKSAQITEESLEAQKLGHQIENFAKQQQAARQTLVGMEKEHDWIVDEVDAFGRPGTPYDFAGHNMSESKRNLSAITERFQGMKKKINPKVMNMIDSVEKKEVSLKNMMRTVIRDKKKIEETIGSLDEYKKEALQKTWEKVNRDFGNIFNELLPGNTAKLDPPEGKTISDGLEVKVCLGKVWKQSLTELSGGQRYVYAPSHTIFPPTSFPTRAIILTISSQFPDSPLPHPGTTPILTCAHVHSRRSGRRARSQPHAEHRPPDQDALQGLAVHRRLPQGRHVPECEPHLQDEVRGRHECGPGTYSCGFQVDCPPLESESDGGDGEEMELGEIRWCSQLSYSDSLIPALVL